jgi:hypothetical protein
VNGFASGDVHDIPSSPSISSLSADSVEGGLGR